jgi:penicillin-binding protein 1A
VVAPASPESARARERRETVPATGKKRKRRRLRAFSILRLFFLLLVWGASLGAAILYYAITTINAELPADLTQALRYQPTRKSLVYSTDGEVIGTFAIENRKEVPLDRMPPHVPAAFVAAEDQTFWEHPGFDLVGIGRAAYKNWRQDTKEGASTITQQVTRMLLLTNEQSYRRKMQEIVLAVRIERELSKAEILTIYLNHAYFGNGAYGVAAAAETYFGKDVENLTIAEAAMLAGLVKAPTKYAPHHSYDEARGRQVYALGRMHEDAYISDAEYQAALDEPIALMGSGAPLNALAAPYFVEQVRREATRLYGESEVWKGGLRFYSTLDTRMQAAAETALRGGIEKLDRRLGFRGPIGKIPAKQRAAFTDGPARIYRRGDKPDTLAVTDRIVPAVRYAAMVESLPGKERVVVDLGPVELPVVEADAKLLRAWRDGEKPKRPDNCPACPLPKWQGKPLAIGDLIPVRIAGEGDAVELAQWPEVEAALIAMEPSTGKVRAMVGGYDWQLSQFNRVTQANRQIGSAIKPFIYAAAIEAGRTPVDVLYDGPVYVPTATGVWSPSNYDNKFTGRTTLRTALAKSLNTISVQLVVEIGLDNVIETMRSLGVVSPFQRHISLSLGTPDLTLMEVATGYAAIASGGRRVEPLLFEIVAQPDGTIVQDHRQVEPGPQVLAPDVAYVVVDMMKGVIERGTGKRARGWGRPSAGKTGTSANYKDVWFIGFTADLLVGVWIGRDDSTPIGDEVTGGTAAVPIWLEFMKAAHPPVPPRDFPVPPGVTFARVEDRSGDPSWPSNEAHWVPFARGTLPAEFGGGRTPTTFAETVFAPPQPKMQ